MPQLSLPSATVGGAAPAAAQQDGKGDEAAARKGFTIGLLRCLQGHAGAPCGPAQPEVSRSVGPA